MKHIVEVVEEKLKELNQKQVEVVEIKNQLRALSKSIPLLIDEKSPEIERVTPELLKKLRDIDSPTEKLWP